MPSSVAEQAPRRHPVLPDIGKPRVAKVVVREPDMPAWNVLLGRALQQAVSVVGWSNKEAAAKVGVDDAEFGKWLQGTRRTQTDRVFAVVELREPYVVALARLAGADVRTEISFQRRSA